MIVRFLLVYLCVAGISSLLVYCACLAAARADEIKREHFGEKPFQWPNAREEWQRHHYPSPSALVGIAHKPTTPLAGHNQLAQVNDL